MIVGLHKERRVINIDDDHCHSPQLPADLCIDSDDPPLEKQTLKHSCIFKYLRVFECNDLVNPEATENIHQWGK